MWLAENLDYVFAYDDGTLPVGETGMPTTPAAWYYNNSKTDYGLNGTYKCGLLYNGYAVDYLEANKATLLPAGWHVASGTDWETLVTSVGGSSTGALKLKSANNSITAGWPSGWNGTDDYGFGVLPGGYRDQTTFVSVNGYTQFWESTAYSESSLYRVQFDTNDAVGWNYNGKINSSYVHLVKTLT
jgi:uncharacterized protein (TIGR02145 family)